jgi:hypothetical protein
MMEVASESGSFMLTRARLSKIARARIQDAKVLLRGRRYDSATYLCGYAVEVALKARIVRVLGWPGFPETSGEFQALESFRIHNLAMLLHLSGSERRIRASFLTEWSAVSQWDPEARYKVVGSATRAAAAMMIQSAETLVKAI